jgi:hypothetical protein
VISQLDHDHSIRYITTPSPKAHVKIGSFFAATIKNPSIFTHPSWTIALGKSPETHLGGIPMHGNPMVQLNINSMIPWSYVKATMAVTVTASWSLG